MKTKIVTIVGARPQFIKAAMVSRVLRGHDGVEEVLVHTGQHYDFNMSKVFFDAMDIANPKYELGIAGGGHGRMTGRMMESLEELLLAERPDFVLVYGDTNSTLAGALAASKLHVPVVHVEAGLRSNNMRMPEEINRVLTDRVSTLLLCPTERAVQNLLSEGYASLDVDIERVGDVMLDAAQFFKDRAEKPPTFPASVRGQFALTTVHRAENTDDPHRLRGIVAALNRLHRRIPVVLPLHPRTRECLARHNLSLEVHTLEPVGYHEMAWLLEQCALVLTDSGGLQKEAWFHSRPCVTLRDETEWTELLDAGGNRLADAEEGAILSAVEQAMASQPDFTLDLYGMGDTAERSVNSIVALAERRR